MTDTLQPLRDALDADEYLTATVSRADLRALLARLNAAEVDAMRYRWLRDEAIESGITCPLAHMTDARGRVETADEGFSPILFDEQLDEAIDAAMKGA